ncbi:glycosyltransferase [Prochlorococcus marinus]|uniref:Beta-monoglucosyldiacylglycerol synthase n=1 Tax=Prochlorococcus marinus (strain MIT 9211) TaxID=93059 RepID=A9BDA3_PROM4|nr:glycosyltransferase family 2 protein [Prochlorococcus marinus]ABX09716.1 Glycosyl transferase, family 2 [Prochlorococcus marinus str. MIT 9211]
MAFAATNGRNRRGKASLFLICCVLLGLCPYLIPASISLLPALILAVLLGIYGLSIVLREIDNRFDQSKLVAFTPEEYQSLPMVDVVVSARDEENVVERLVERLISIRYPKDKITRMIIDDGSKDKTSILLNQLTQTFQEIQVLNRSRSSGGGKSGALNYALSKLNGKWIFILDADAQFNDDILLRIIPFAEKYGLSAVQLRKAVINSGKNLLTHCQSMEMAMDAFIQQGRIFVGGVGELRGNGQLIERNILNKCGGFNEDTLTDDLDLSFRLLIVGANVGLLWNPPIQEEAVESLGSLWRQRNRWAEGGLQRFFDYWSFLFSGRLGFVKKLDLGCFFTLQYVLPVVSSVDLLIATWTHSFPLYWPLSCIALSVSGVAYFRGCRRKSQGPDLPSPKLLRLLISVIYLIHWFIVIPWVTIKMAVLPKKLVWNKTTHQGN